LQVATNGFGGAILSTVPYYMDRHDLVGMKPEDIAQAHMQDLAVQSRFDVNFLTYWFDMGRQTAFCLATGPSGEAVEAAHRASHGLVGTQIIEVDQTAVERFMGGLLSHQPGEPYVETAFRTILFTDMEGSTTLTQRLGDAAAMGMVRDHDRVVAAALGRNGGSEVKHTGDGSMSAFPSVTSAIRSAIEIQRDVEGLRTSGSPPIRVRVGLAAGEPVTERNDLFGAAVQQAARLCQIAQPGSILVSSGVHDLARGKSFRFGPPRRRRLKGFDAPISAYEVLWRD
jgi:class 3 adenylate cyclase